MSTQIIDGFNLGSSVPIDDRIVASGSTERNNITYKYEGLRVFDTSDEIPYVWVNGAWQSENVINISGSGDYGYLPLFSSSNTIENSIIYQGTNSNIGIGITSSPSEKLDVGGNVKAVDFIGGGVNLTDLSADNISSGELDLARLANGNNGYLLSSGASQPVYINPNNITVGTSSVSLVSSNILVSSTSIGTSNYLIFATSSNGSNSPRVSSNITFDAVNGYLLLGNGLKIGNTSTNTISSSSRFAASYVGGFSHLVDVATIAVTYSTTLSIEANFTAKTVATSLSDISQNNKLIITLSVGASGSIAIVGTQSDIHSANNNTINRNISDGYVDYSTSGIVKLKQSVSSNVGHDFYSQVYYNIVVT